MFAQLKSFIGGLEPNTQNGFNSILREYFAFVGGSYNEEMGAHFFLHANVEMASKYINFIQNKRGVSPRLYSVSTTATPGTVRTKIATLSRIYDVLIRYGLGVFNPFKDPSFDKLRRNRVTRPTEMVAFNKVKKLVLYPPLDHPEGVRDRAILGVLFGAALRRSELAELRIGDLRRSPKGTFYFHLRKTKGGDTANQPLATWALTLAQDLIEFRMKRGAIESDYLFVSHWGEPLKAHGIYLIFKRWAFAAGLGESITPHSARATSITKLLADGITHSVVKDFARHKDIHTTERYNKIRMTIDESPTLKFVGL